MSKLAIAEEILDKFKDKEEIYKPLKEHFRSNEAANKYLELCQEMDWDFEIDHAAIRTHDVKKVAEKYEKLGWEFDEKIDYPEEGWWAKVYRHPLYITLFIDQSYEEEKGKDQIIKRWVDKFGEYKFHHIAVLLDEEVEIEKVIDMLKKKGIEFPGKITGQKGSRLRQTFTQAETVDGFPYTVLELTQRNRDPKTGKIYYGFINEQADSLMKDSVL